MVVFQENAWMGEKALKRNRKYSIVVPTRNRADTLYFCLKTCMAQQYDNLEILVCDNSSNTQTQEVVQTLQQQDPRIRCVKPSKALGMTSNWNFAMEHVLGDFVTYLGDDDGLLPNAVSWVNDILEIHDVEAVTWNSAQYNWPKARIEPNQLLIPLSQKSFLIQSKIFGQLMARHLVSYGRSPIVYKGFVRAEAMRRLKVKTGRYFWSSSPDIYSGMALLSELDRYFFTYYPFSVMGGSHHSNGLAYLERKANDQQKRFLIEHDVSFHPKMRPIPGAIHSGILESLLEANDRCFQGKLEIDMASHVKLIVQQVARLDATLREDAFRLLKELDLGASLQKKILRWQKEFSSSEPQAEQHHSDSALVKRYIRIDTSERNIEDIENACDFVKKIFPPYTVPKHVTSASMLVYAATFLHRKFKNLIDAYLFE